MHSSLAANIFLASHWWMSSHQLGQQGLNCNDSRGFCMTSGITAMGYQLLLNSTISFSMSGSGSRQYVNELYSWGLGKYPEVTLTPLFLSLSTRGGKKWSTTSLNLVYLQETRSQLQHIGIWPKWRTFCRQHLDGLVQDCSNSSALAMELLQSCTKSSILYIFSWMEISACWVKLLWN